MEQSTMLLWLCGFSPRKGRAQTLAAVEAGGIRKAAAALGLRPARVRDNIARASGIAFRENRALLEALLGRPLDAPLSPEDFVSLIGSDAVRAYRPPR